jgi:hypothetical protein
MAVAGRYCTRTRKNREGIADTGFVTVTGFPVPEFVTSGIQAPLERLVRDSVT